jgi:hypothetical protein
MAAKKRKRARKGSKKFSKFVIRKGSLTEELYMQPHGGFGDYKTAKRFSREAVDKAAASFERAHGKNYGVFPVSKG